MAEKLPSWQEIDLATTNRKNEAQRIAAATSETLGPGEWEYLCNYQPEGILPNSDDRTALVIRTVQSMKTKGEIKTWISTRVAFGLDGKLCPGDCAIYVKDRKTHLT